MAPYGLLLESRYQLEERIAVGGMGEVWQGADLLLERPVAVKLLRPGYARQEEELARFRAEARHAASLCHPAIARVYDYCEADPPHPPYLVMELVDGPSLARLLDAGPLDAARTMSIVAQTATGLQAAHTAGLVHRDIKPGNLLVSKSGQVKITDFGIAHAAGSAPITRTGLLVGTPAYLAPERAAGASATPASDLYALGIVAYQCLTGRLPFHGDPLAVALAHHQQPLPPLPASIPAQAAALVTELTAKDPAARPPSAGHVAERAGQLHAALMGPAARPPSPSARAVPERQLRPTRRPPPGPNANAARPPRAHTRRSRAKTLARVALALSAVAVLGTAGWMTAGMSGLASLHQHPGPPPVTQQADSRHGPPTKPARTQGPNTAATPAAATAPAAPAPGETRPPASSGQPPTPAASSPSPSQTPTPSDSPTPSPAPSPTGASPAGGAPVQLTWGPGAAAPTHVRGALPLVSACRTRSDLPNMPEMECGHSSRVGGRRPGYDPRRKEP